MIPANLKENPLCPSKQMKIKEIPLKINFICDHRNLYKLFGFFLGDLRPDPPKPRGDLKNPEGMAGPRAVGPRTRHARGVFQIPDRAEGDLAKIPEE